MAGKRLTNSTTSIEADACMDCLQGKYSGASSMFCSSCAGGKYSDISSESCTLCDSGAYSGVGAGACKGCAAGKRLINATIDTEFSACIVSVS
jgi:hypothetical protein